MEYFNIEGGCGTCVPSVLKRRVGCGHKERIINWLRMTLYYFKKVVSLE